MGRGGRGVRERGLGEEEKRGRGGGRGVRERGLGEEEKWSKEKK